MSFDLEFRPAGYADFDNPVALALNGIKGQMRRETVRDMMSAEGEQRALYDQLLGPVDEGVLGESASPGFTASLNRRFGPSWMGGEYLPGLRGREVEIARVVLASVTMDVFSVRARLGKRGYRYRMVDEYETRFDVRPRTSVRTLTLGRLVGLIDTADGLDLGLSGRAFVEAWWWQQLESGDSLEDCTAFAWVESEQYPELGAYYEERARRWREERAAEGRVGGKRW